MPIPTFSVVIPLFNKSTAISRALKSIDQQTWPPQEIIVVDDGSTDDGPTIVSLMSEKMSSLRLVKKPNGGAASARNLGIELATGNYIAFLDADDEWKPAFLENIADLIEQYPNAVAFATGYANYSSSLCLQEVLWSTQNKSNLISPTEYFSRIYKSGRSINNSSCTVLPKAVLSSNELSFDEDMRYYEDHSLWYRCLILGSIASKSEVLAIIHKDGANRSNASENLDQLRLATLRLEEVLHDFSHRASSNLPESLVTLLHQRKTMALKIALSHNAYNEASRMARDFGLSGVFGLCRYPWVCRITSNMQTILHVIRKLRPH